MVASPAAPLACPSSCFHPKPPLAVPIGLVRDGDKVLIDIPNPQQSILLCSDEENSRIAASSRSKKG